MRFFEFPVKRMNSLYFMLKLLRYYHQLQPVFISSLDSNLIPYVIFGMCLSVRPTGKQPFWTSFKVYIQCNGEHYFCYK